MHLARWNRWLRSGLNAFAVLAIMASAVSAQGGESGDEPGDGEGGYIRPIPCPPSFSDAIAHYKGTTWGGHWTKFDTTQYMNQGWYRPTADPYVSLNQRWEWINAEGRFSCNEHVIVPFVLVLLDYHMLEGKGEIVPYGSEDELEYELVEGEEAGYPGDDETYYWCWYYLYGDGTRSKYFACERVD